MRRVCSALIAIVGLAISACTPSPTPSTAQLVSQPPAEASDYLIGPGDVLKIFVWQNPDLSVTVPVRPDGRISVPLLQDVEAAQKTPPQVAQEIKTGLSEF